MSRSPPPAETAPYSELIKREVRLRQARAVVETAAGLGLGDDVLDVPPGLLVVVDVEMPAIQVGVGDVIVVARRVVLDEPRRGRRARGSASTILADPAPGCRGPSCSLRACPGPRSR